MKLTIATFCLAIAVGLVGCSTPPAADAAKPADGTGASVTQVKCAQCSKMVAKADTVEHGADIICKECEALHNH